jgi:2-methylisocitrate lyase-like PEP mutase family enzyme
MTRSHVASRSPPGCVGGAVGAHPYAASTRKSSDAKPGRETSNLSQAAQIRLFRHSQPWDIGSARYLQHLGFKALASTSAGYAFAQGLPDNAVKPRHDARAPARAVRATDVPVNADYEGGYAHEARQGRRECAAVRRDRRRRPFDRGFNRRQGQALYDLDAAVARIRAARAAIDKAGGDVVFTGR